MSSELTILRRWQPRRTSHRFIVSKTSLTRTRH